MEEWHIVEATREVEWIFDKSKSIRIVDNGKQIVVFAYLYLFIDFLQRKVVLDLLQALLVLLPIADALRDPQPQEGKHLLFNSNLL